MVQTDEERKAKRRKYSARPEVKAKRKTPEAKAKEKVLKDKWNEKNKEHSQKYREERRDVFNAQQKKSNHIRKNKVLTYYSKNNFPECVCCGEKSNLIFLTLDHIEGRKNVTHKKRLGGNSLYTWITKNNFPSGYQTLCHNCNSAKSDSEICPHQRRLK